MKRFIELVEKEEGVDLTKKDAIVQVDDAKEAEEVLQGLKKLGFNWVDSNDIKPLEDANNKCIFFFSNPYYIVIDFEYQEIGYVEYCDCETECCCEISKSCFLKYVDEYDKLPILPLALLNTSILTTAGVYKLTDISLEEAKELVNQADSLDSAIGHKSTADVMTTLLEKEIAVNRQMFVQEVGQQALVFKLNGRAEEGKILTVEEIEQMGYKFQLLERTE